jgi:5'-deoxynucleotidase YfbR-like HD superfamily hydrolase
MSWDQVWDKAWDKVKSCTVPLKTQAGIIGTGFFITKDGYLLTCAHVIEEAGGYEKIKVQEKSVELVYRGSSCQDDIAVLRVPEYQGDAVPLSLDFHRMGEFLSIGYSRSDFLHGASIKGQITDVNPHLNYGSLPMLRLSVVSDSERIEGGCSGSPVFDVESQSVIGLIAAHDRTQGALAVPLVTVCESWSLLRKYLDPKYQEKERSLDELHNVVLLEYLSPIYLKDSIVRQHTYEEYSRFFKVVSSIETTKKLYLFESFEKLKDTICNCKHEVAFWIQGASGTGKTSFLNLLYWYFYKPYFEDKGKILPVFINLHRYSRCAQRCPKKESSDSNELNLEEQAIEQIQQHLRPLQNFVSLCSSQRLLVIIDGYDKYSELEERIFRYLVGEYLSNYSCTYVIGSKEEHDFSLDIPLSSPKNCISFMPVKVDSSSLSNLIEAFLNISLPSGYAEKTEYLEDLIKKYKLEEIDLFILSLLKCKTKTGCTQLHPMSQLLQYYCQDYLRKARLIGAAQQYNQVLDRSAQLAFSHEVNEANDISNEEDAVFLELIYCHPKIRDYLIARYIVNQLFKIQDNAGDEAISDVARILKCVQPSRINRFCKEIVNQDDRSKKIGLAAIKKLLGQDNADSNAKSFACYLIGRLEGKQWRSHVYKILEDFKKNLSSNIGESRYLFLSRTAYVSLAYLGSNDYKEEYVNLLLSDPKVDQVNRGFHLEYYEDQKVIDSSELMNKDLLQQYPKTFKKLSDNILNRKENPLFEIELHTLCSLAQHRHAEGKLDNELRLDLVSILKKVLDDGGISNSRLRTYVQMVFKHIKHEHFCVGLIFDDYYKLKITKRQGWFIRGIKNGESVADHTYGAYLIALFLLPDSWEEEESYSKEKILNMLLIHDLAEAVVHDIPSFKQTLKDKTREAEVYDEIEMLGTYADQELPSLKNVADLWREFEYRKSFNACVAKEIDLLENWVQLQIYNAEGYVIANYPEWCKELIDKIKTAPGCRVMDKLTTAYSDLEKVKKIYEGYKIADQQIPNE